MKFSAAVSVYDKLSRDDILTQSAALALYTIFSLAPLVVLMVFLQSTLNLSLQKELLSQVQYLFGVDAAEVLGTIIDKSKERPDLTGTAGWLGLGALLLSSMAVFGQMQTSLNTIFKKHHRTTQDESWYSYIKNFLMRRLISFGMVLTFIFISIVSLVVSSLLSGFYSEETGQLALVLNLLLSFVVFSALFSAIFKWMPDRKIPFSTAVRGGVLTSILFVLGKYFIGLYIGQAAIGSAYGAAGSLVVLLVWVYYSSLIFFFGAEVASVILLGKNKGGKLEFSQVA
jgi:membrane protein